MKVLRISKSGRRIEKSIGRWMNGERRRGRNQRRIQIEPAGPSSSQCLFCNAEAAYKTNVAVHAPWKEGIRNTHNLSLSFSLYTHSPHAFTHTHTQSLSHSLPSCNANLSPFFYFLSRFPSFILSHPLFLSYTDSYSLSLTYTHYTHTTHTLHTHSLSLLSKGER